MNITAMPAAAASPPGFNAISGGYVFTLFGDNNDDEITDITVQTDGKIVAAGLHTVRILQHMV